MPFLMVSVVLFMYFGLTQETEQSYGMKGKRALFLIRFAIGWKYSWIVFIAAVGFEVLIEAIFSAKRKE